MRSLTGQRRGDSLHDEESCNSMPRKLRELIRELEAAGFVDRGGRGSHRNFVHPKVARPLTLAGRAGGDAKAYQEKAVRSAIREAQQ